MVCHCPSLYLCFTLHLDLVFPTHLRSENFECCARLKFCMLGFFLDYNCVLRSSVCTTVTRACARYASKKLGPWANKCGSHLCPLRLPHTPLSLSLSLSLSVVLASLSLSLSLSSLPLSLSLSSLPFSLFLSSSLSSKKKKDGV